MTDPQISLSDHIDDLVALIAREADKIQRLTRQLREENSSHCEELEAELIHRLRCREALTNALYEAREMLADQPEEQQHPYPQPETAQ